MADLYAKYCCTYCQEEIAGLRVRCTECPDFDICLLCFSAGAEIGQHRNDHSYQFMDSGAVGIFHGRGSWSAKEEVRLLDAIEQYGFGNWEDIAKHIETRSPEEAKDEYINRYLEGSIGRVTWGGGEPPSRPVLPSAGEDAGPLGPAAVARLPPLALTPEEAAQLGYMPNRDDFEREHDHDAEQIISSLALNTEDDDLDIALKLSQVDIYTRRLRERTRRKRLVRDYQLVSTFFNNFKNKGKVLTKMAKEKKDFLDRLRPFTRFSSRAEHTTITAALWRERELRVRIAELCRYRKHGITAVEECAHFERHAAARPATVTLAQRMAGSSGCTAQATPSQQDLSPTLPPNPRRREGESGSSSTSPRSTRDASTVCGCCKKLSCTSTSSSSCSTNLHLLTNNEHQICSTLNMPPLQYITMKTVLLRNQAGQRPLSHTPPNSSSPIFGDTLSNGAETIVSRYLQASGWAQSTS